MSEFCPRGDQSNKFLPKKIVEKISEQRSPKISVTRLGDLFGLWATINLPKFPTFINNFCKGVKIYNFWATFIDIWRFFSGYTAQEDDNFCSKFIDLFPREIFTYWHPSSWTNPGLFFCWTANQLVHLPPHIPWRGQGGGILLLRYSVICVSDLTIFVFSNTNFTEKLWTSAEFELISSE